MPNFNPPTKTVSENLYETFIFGYLTFSLVLPIMGITMKERDTVIIPIRVKKKLVSQMTLAIVRSKKPSRNAWLIWAIQMGLRKHKARFSRQEKDKIIMEIVRNEQRETANVKGGDADGQA